MFVNSLINVTEKSTLMLMVLRFGGSSIGAWFHIPLPSGAAFLSLPQGTSHGTNIFLKSILYMVFNVTES